MASAQQAERTVVPKEIVEAFSKIDVEDIGDVLGGLGLRSIAQGIYPIDPGMRICGPAVTMRQISSRDTQNWARHEEVLINMCVPGDVLVMDIGGRMDCATWGEIIAIEANNVGLNGAVIDGAIRDADEVIGHGCQTFSRGLTLRHAHGYLYSTCLNDYPVQIGEGPMQIMVAPGDLVVGDRCGVAVVPAERAKEVLELALMRQEVSWKARDLMLQGLGHGDPEVDVMIAKARDLEGVEQAEGYKW